jgi:hypothetical protein
LEALPPSTRAPKEAAGAFGDELVPPAPSELETKLVPQSFSPVPTRRPPPAAGLRSSLFTMLVLVPLISYAVLATIAVLILYFRPPQPSLEFLPDVDGDLRGAKHQKRALSYQLLDPDSPLPNRLKVNLGETIRLGDVAVTPQRVELIRLHLGQGDDEVDPPAAESLVLHLVMQNVSEDVVFSPTDPYFDRQWKSSQDAKPYTFLEIGRDRIYGGPFPWRPGRAVEDRKTVEGQHYQLLQLGERLTTIVCTDPTEQVAKLLAAYHGTLLWRVQVRRGLVRVGEREVPATAVFGVTFQDRDIHKPET